MKHLAKLSDTNIPMKNGAEIPALGFGTLIPNIDDTVRATKAALEIGFRQFDCAERYRNEEAVGEAFQEVLGRGGVKREEIFVGTKLWNNNHRPERVKPAFGASLRALRVDYVDLYLIHTPFAFQPGAEQDPQDKRGEVIYDHGVTLLDTWGALEQLVEEGKCGAIGLADVNLEQLREVDGSARIRPAVVQVESHPYLPQWELLEFCKRSGIVFLAFAPLGHSFEPKLLDDPVIKDVARRAGMSPAQVCIAWGVQRGTAILTTSTKVNHLRENFEASFLSESAINEISAIQTRYRFNRVVETGVPGFIPPGKLICINVSCWNRVGLLVVETAHRMSHNPAARIQPVEVFTMRADIAPGATFPDCELSDHTGKHRKLCELQGQHPISRDRHQSDSVLDGGAHFGRW